MVSVSPRYGEVLSFECKEDHIVLQTETGKAVYEYDGRIPWSRICVEVNERIREALRDRVEFEIRAIRYSSGIAGTGGAIGRISIDGEVIATGRYESGDFTTPELGAALAAYLELSGVDALESEDPLVSAVALLDGKFDEDRIRAQALRDHPVWTAFYELRTGNH